MAFGFGFARLSRFGVFRAGRFGLFLGGRRFFLAMGWPLSGIVPEESWS